jgi:lipopolysaccharide transport system ATP-binding protein
LNESSDASSTAIEARDVSRRFRLWSGSLKRSLIDRHTPNPEIWALRDVSFSVARGSSLGIVGDNGSGKSTLLKVLSGVMPPTSGSVRVSGRIGVLIEIGAGFHPDLTGRENVYLNASLLGLRRSEVRRRFDEIVAFAELDSFMDTPVKRYSSGMFLRLGFAIASHVDAEVLLIDEVLAVGDASFQRKCLARLRDFRGAGGTLVLVSHSLGLIAEHCADALWLEHGVVRGSGKSSVVADDYARAAATRLAVSALESVAPRAATALDAPVGGGVTLSNIEVLDLAGQPASTIRPGEAIRVRASYVLDNDAGEPHFELAVVRADGLTMFTTVALAGAEVAVPGRRGQVIVELPLVGLGPAMYSLRLAATLPADTSAPGRADRSAVEAALEVAADSVGAESAGDVVYMPAHWRVD